MPYLEGEWRTPGNGRHGTHRLVPSGHGHHRTIARRLSRGARGAAAVTGRTRVVEAHRLVRMAFGVAAGFGVAAATWAVIVGTRGGSWWGPIHTFLVGAVLASISGATQMFTITWSSAPPPSRRWSGLQGGFLVGGTALVLVGVSNGSGFLVWAGGILVVGALVLLGVILRGVIRRSLLRRFDLSSRFYLLALGCGTVGVTLGILLGSGAVADTYAATRLVHLHLNLTGLVGFTILGTIPTLLPTFAHRRAAIGREAVVGWHLCGLAALLLVSGLFGPAWVVGLGALTVGVAALTITSGTVLRLGGRGVAERLPYFHVVTGITWLAAWTFVDAHGLLTGTPLPSFAGWTAAAVVGGIGQVLVGSVAYLLPVAMGPPVSDNLRRMGRWPAVPLLALNAAATFLVAGIPAGVAVAGGVWLVDFVRRVATVRRPRPTAASA